jgi:hypothetical protein
MKKMCSFCGTIINPGTSPEAPVSHGVCKSCYTSIMTDHGFNVQKFLDLLDAPVFLVDDDVNILAANSLAIAAVKKPPALVRGNLCGDVIECVNAFLPEGCGKTKFCSDCTIRSTVNETYRTGSQVTRRPADVTLKAGNREEKMHLLITTRKDCDVVLLRLEFDKKM